MEKDFERSVFRGHLLKGKLRTAMEYLSRFPGQAELYRKYVSLFQEENYFTYDVGGGLNEILLLYQKYYREVFYLEQSAEDAAQRLQARLAERFQAGANVPLDELEEKAAEAFRSQPLYVLTGRTGGYYGPYIWRTEELKRCTVELPDGAQDYAIKFLDGFIMKSWLDYLSFGMTGTGGWSNGDGLIHCVKESYDLESESFQVSLLKHEAQHAMDLEAYPGMASADLEYRAKLVELIYSSQRRLLDQFLLEADGTRADNGHGLAARRIIQGFQERLHLDGGGLSGLPIEQVQTVSRELFVESGAEMAAKYR